MNGIIKAIKVITVICGFIAGLQVFRFAMSKILLLRGQKTKRTKFCSVGMIDGADEPTVFCVMRLPAYQKMKRLAGIFGLVGAVLQGLTPKKRH